MAEAWVYVVNSGSGTPNVVRKSHAATTVAQVQPGEYVVTFPASVRALTCVATLNNSVGTITAVPGDHSGLSPNQVRVLTLSLGNQLVGSYDFSVAVFYSARLVVVRTPVIKARAKRKNSAKRRKRAR